MFFEMSLPNSSKKCSILRVKSFIAFFLFALSLPIAASLQAQSTCSHTLCAQAGNLLKGSYVKNLSQSFGEAYAISAVSAMPYIGKTRVDLFTVGVQGNIGVRSDISGNIETGGQELSNLTQPSSLVFSGFYFGGINLGLVSLGVLSDFDLLVSHADINDFPMFGGLRYSFKTNYVGIRYQLISGIGLPVLGAWKGIVLGLGYLSPQFRFSQKNDSPSNLSVGGLELRPDQEKFNIESELSSIPLEINTGVEILFFNATAGVGFLFNTGESKLKYEWQGNAFMNGMDQGSLSISPEEKTDLPSYIYYYKMGLEFPILPFARLGGEISYANEGDFAYAFAMRVSL